MYIQHMHIKYAYKIFRDINRVFNVTQRELYLHCGEVAASVTYDQRS